MKKYILQELHITQDLVNQIIQNDHIVTSIANIVTISVTALKKGNKILFMGNGGSAADAQHLSAELVSRFSFDRPGLAAIALTTDTSALTAIGNDYGYEKLFSRQIEALGRSGDILFGLSTSGKSANVLNGLKKAKEMHIVTVGFTGESSEYMAPCCTHILSIPSNCTPKIQEAHITIGHIICGLIEKEMFLPQRESTS